MLTDECAMYNCKSRISERPEVKFFRFPFEREWAFVWRTNCRIPNYISHGLLYRRYRVCSKHFAPYMFTNDLKNQLSAEAVPQSFAIFEAQQKKDSLQRLVDEIGVNETLNASEELVNEVHAGNLLEKESRLLVPASSSSTAVKEAKPKKVKFVVKRAAKIRTVSSYLNPPATQTTNGQPLILAMPNVNNPALQLAQCNMPPPMQSINTSQAKTNLPSNTNVGNPSAPVTYNLLRVAVPQPSLQQVPQRGDILTFAQLSKTLFVPSISDVKILRPLSNAPAQVNNQPVPQPTIQPKPPKVKTTQGSQTTQLPNYPTHGKGSQTDLWLMYGHPKAIQIRREIYELLPEYNRLKLAETKRKRREKEAPEPRKTTFEEFQALLYKYYPKAMADVILALRNHPAADRFDDAFTFWQMLDELRTHMPPLPQPTNE